MADEVAGNPTGDAGATAIDQAFGATPSTEAAPAANGADGAPAPAPAPEPKVDLPGRPEYIPEKFWVAGEDPTKGQLNVEGLSKAYTDTQAELTRKSQLLAEATKGQEALPLTPDAYWTDLDTAAIKARAPNAYGEPVEGEVHSDLKDILTAAHHNGIAKPAAQKLAGDILALVEKRVEAPKTDAQMRAEAIGELGPNGAQIAQDVQARLRQLGSQGVFDQSQLGFIKGAAMTAPGLAVLATLLRASGPSGPPDLQQQQQMVPVDKTTQAAEIAKLLADPVATETRMPEIKAMVAKYEKDFGDMPDAMKLTVG